MFVWIQKEEETGKVWLKIVEKYFHMQYLYGGGKPFRLGGGNANFAIYNYATKTNLFYFVLRWDHEKRR